MKEFGVRLLSALLYAILLVGAMFHSQEAFLTLFFLFGVVVINELQKLLIVKSYIAYIVLIGCFLAFSYFDINDNATYVFLIATLFVNSVLIKDLLVINKIPLFNQKKYIVVFFYLIGSLIFLTLIPSTQGYYAPDVIFGCFALVWFNDSWAYIIGKNFGKHKLYERISPKKSVEGFIGGLVFSILGAWVVTLLTNELSLMHWFVIALIISIFGTIGDLIQSKFKRQAEVKDSGNLMPGHGGLFDRLDSILFASPFIYTYLELLNYVP
ncbi:phosphatidate cytidylyltransferase [Croceibacter atlanticus]|jgi:phosphatidate cytidylyltransferase|nr:phosphatidate cytidylyltransferase [Croceibacter atlanticus]|tara:strand:+ start:177924 stop:178727 length:804 start_codon:yes stop_codon:yes gene_type:complete